LHLCIHIYTDMPDFGPTCKGNIELMQAFTQHGYHLEELGTLNQCQMYLQAIWLSDICIGNGTTVNSGAWSRDHICNSPYCWLVTEKPKQGEWRLWQKALTKSFSLKHWCILSNSLGPWYPSNIKWGWYLDMDTNHLWHY